MGQQAKEMPVHRMLVLVVEAMVLV